MAINLPAKDFRGESIAAMTGVIKLVELNYSSVEARVQVDVFSNAAASVRPRPGDAPAEQPLETQEHMARDANFLSYFSGPTLGPSAADDLLQQQAELFLIGEVAFFSGGIRV